MDAGTNRNRIRAGATGIACREIAPYDVYTFAYINEKYIMNLTVAKWGNSLALRIPADYVRHIGIKEGDSVQASLTMDGGLCIRPSRWDRKAFTLELSKAREHMPMSESVIEELRRGARY